MEDRTCPVTRGTLLMGRHPDIGVAGGGGRFPWQTPLSIFCLRHRRIANPNLEKDDVIDTVTIGLADM
jgi:hypothetical protein